MQREKIELRNHLEASRVLDLAADTKDAALVELVDAVSSSTVVQDRDALLEAVRERESKLSTGIGLGIAVPHARIESVTEFVVAVGRHGSGLEFGSIDGRPVHIVVLIVGPREAKMPYLELLAQLSKRLKLEDVRAKVTGGAEPEDVVQLLVGEG
jgi:PTS system nitrogen regulatory IIA component